MSHSELDGWRILRETFVDSFALSMEVLQDVLPVAAAAGKCDHKEQDKQSINYVTAVN